MRFSGPCGFGKKALSEFVVADDAEFAVTSNLCPRSGVLLLALTVAALLPRFRFLPRAFKAELDSHFELLDAQDGFRREPLSRIEAVATVQTLVEADEALDCEMQLIRAEPVGQQALDVLAAHAAQAGAHALTVTIECCDDGFPSLVSLRHAMAHSVERSRRWPVFTTRPIATSSPRRGRCVSPLMFRID